MRWDGSGVGERAGVGGQRLAEVDVSAAASAGVAAGFAYVAEMTLDLLVVGHRADDLRLLGGVLFRDRARARRAGLLMHLGASAALGVTYAALARDRLPGPPWLRGVVFANIENAILYPLALLEDLHPGIKRGEIDRYWTATAFLQSIPRHVAYGVVVGSLYERLRPTR